MPKSLRSFIFIFFTLIPVGVWAQSPEQQVRQCRADNLTAHAEIVNLFQNARKQGKVSRTESAGFDREEANLKRHEQSLRRAGLTLAECREVGRELASERTYVERIAATPAGDSRVAQCRAANLKAHAEIVKMFRDSRAQGKISRGEADRFDREEASMTRLERSLTKDGLTLAECEQITRELAAERAYVQRIAATPAGDPRVAQCRAANLKAHAEIVKMFRDSRAQGKISRGEAERFDREEASMTRLERSLNRDGLTLSECEQITRELAAERAYVQRIAATPAGDPRVAQCRAANLKAHAEIQKMFRDSRAQGAISRGEAERFEREEASMARLERSLNRDGLTLNECEQITRELAAERAYVQRIAAAPAGDPRVAQCRAANLKAHAEIVKMFRDSRAKGAISRGEAERFDREEAGMTRLERSLTRDGLTLNECEQITRELAAERTCVQRIAALPEGDPRVAQCRADNLKAHTEILKLFHDVRDSGKVNRAEARGFEEREAQLERRRRDLSSDGLALGECQQITRELTEERRYVVSISQ